MGIAGGRQGQVGAPLERGAHHAGPCRGEGSVCRSQWVQEVCTECIWYHKGIIGALAWAVETHGVERWVGAVTRVRLLDLLIELLDGQERVRLAAAVDVAKLTKVAFVIDGDPGKRWAAEERPKGGPKGGEGCRGPLPEKEG